MVQGSVDVAWEDSLRPQNLVWFCPIRNSPGTELPSEGLSPQRHAVGSNTEVGGDFM